MKITKKYPDGMFGWVDLTTTDIDGAHAFYSGLFGWEPDPQPLPGGGSYTNFRIDGHPVAGGGQMMPDMQASGAPSVWISYVIHSDIDAVAARTTEAGGNVFLPPMDVMDQGRMALLMDPTGAPLGLWQPAKHIGAQIVNQPNSLTWNELQTRDLAAARAFYHKVFGWSDKTDDNGYVMWHEDDRAHCGALALTESWGDAPSQWMVYFLVDDVDATAARVAELGGTVEAGPITAGEIGRLIVIADPQGAHFAAIQYNAPAAEPPGTD